MTDGWAEEDELDRLAQWEARNTGDPLAADMATYLCARCGGTRRVDALPYTRAPGTGPQTDCPDCAPKETT